MLRELAMLLFYLSERPVMKLADPEILKMLDAQADQLKRKILDAPDTVTVPGTVYYVAADGDDENSGTDEQHPWKSTERVSAAALEPGDAVRFRRGDLFRGQVLCRAGVTYAAYGKGPKPMIYGSEKDLADEDLWECADAAHHIYRLKEKMPDCGTLVFNEGERHSRKLIPSYIGGKFVCRDDAARDFVMAEEMTEDLDLFCACTAVMTEQMSHGETWPVPQVRGCDNRGDLYLRCDAGNPGRLFRSIEALPARNILSLGNQNNITVDNLCLKYGGAHAIRAGGPCIRGLHVSNCEIGWIGGCIQHYLGTDPNYPEGVRGSVTRFGNGIEVYGGCEDYLCENNYIYQVYDAGVTHQYTNRPGGECHMNRVRYTGNLIEYCVYSIEYFLARTGGTASMMDGLEIDRNILRFSGFGWGQQRHNTWTPAHIKSWNYENPAVNYSVHDNIFDRAKYRLLHLCCEKRSSYPHVDGNTYVQTFGRSLGQFGAVSEGDVPVLSFFETSDADIENAAGDRRAAVYYLKED